MNEIAEGLYAYEGIIGTNRRVAAFDLDWTLIRTISNKFVKDQDDWKLLPNRIKILRQYRDEGYTLAIFTNQGYIGNKLSIAIKRINKIIERLEVDGLKMWVFAATGKMSIYRKPNRLMWPILRQYIVDIDIENSIYVGDAGGRNKNYSDDDRKYAEGIRIEFKLPEEIFPNNEIKIPNEQTMFIFVGMPGAGKSTFYHKKLEQKGWMHAKEDIVKTENKLIKEVIEGLKEGKSVAVDGTNGSRKKRRKYINMAIKYKVPTIIIYFVRNGYEINKLRINNKVPEILYNIYYKKLEEPSMSIDGVPVIEFL